MATSTRRPRQGQRTTRQRRSSRGSRSQVPRSAQGRQRSRSGRRPPRRRRGASRLNLLLILLIAAVCLGGWHILRPALRLTSPDTSAPSAGEAEVQADAASLTTLDEDWVTVSLLPENRYSRPGLALKQVNGVVIHYTGNPGTTAEQTVSYFSNLAQTGETYASSHFVIGIDGTVIQCVPLNEESYCSNDRNSDTIAIECCHPDETGEFTAETRQALIRLTRCLVETYQLKQDQVIRHYDVTGKLCPLYYVEHKDAWNDFKEDVFSGVKTDSGKKRFWPF